MQGLLGGSRLARLYVSTYLLGDRNRCGGLKTFEVRLLTGDLCPVKTHETRLKAISDCHLHDYFPHKFAFSCRGC